MPAPPEETLYGDILKKWLKKGEKKLTIEDETDFVDPQILKGILNSKVSFFYYLDYVLFEIIINTMNEVKFL